MFIQCPVLDLWQSCPQETGDFGDLKPIKKQPDHKENDFRAKSIFDPGQFELATMQDRALQIEILLLFNQQLDSVTQKLQAGELVGQNRKFLGHTLRGAAAAVGALEIEELASLWEACVEDQARLLKNLSHAISRFREATAHYISH